jgi:hypothetical protein
MATTETTTASAELLDRCCPMCGAAVPDRAAACEACGEPLEVPSANPPPAPLDGWLVFPAVGTLLAPIVYLLAGTRLFLRNVESGHFVLWSSGEGLLGMFLIWLAAYSLYVAIEFFMRTREAPTLVIVAYVADLVAWVGGALAAAAEFGAPERNIALVFWTRSMFCAAIGIAYFRTSQRVKDTFVN